MHFPTLSTAATALTLIVLASAAPTPNPSPAMPATAPAGYTTLLLPTTTSQYSVWTGAVTSSASIGKIFKDGHTSDISTLLTFDFPTSLAGQTCSFHFYLPSGSATGVSGSGAFDVFTSLAPAGASTTSWPSGNLRDQQYGRMNAVVGGEATWVEGFPLQGRSFPCPAGVRLGGELVPTGDADSISWAVGSAGGYILAHN
jgi:hypothetical protein